jgi:hypothetical protein
VASCWRAAITANLWTDKPLIIIDLPGDVRSAHATVRRFLE